MDIKPPSIATITKLLAALEAHPLGTLLLVLVILSIGVAGYGLRAH